MASGHRRRRWRCRRTTLNPSSCNRHCCRASCAPCQHLHHPPQLSTVSPISVQAHRISQIYRSTMNIFENITFTKEDQLTPQFPPFSAAESALRRRSSHSLRNAAAHNMQANFRTFLRRRSRTLRQLRDHLASIKSTLGVLKSLLSKRAHFDYGVVYHKAVILLLKLDAIQLFPNLDKVVFLDDDVVIQRDLTPLWEIDLNGKVNGAVETYEGDDKWVMSKRFRNYFNFSHPLIAKSLNPDDCAWAYGMNIFDLRAWRKTNIRDTYHYWLKENIKSNLTLWKLGTLPPALIAFKDHVHQNRPLLAHAWVGLPDQD